MVPIPSRTTQERRGHHVITRSDLYGTTPSGLARVKLECDRCPVAGLSWLPDDDTAIREAMAVHDAGRHRAPAPGLF